MGLKMALPPLIGAANTKGAAPIRTGQPIGKINLTREGARDTPYTGRAPSPLARAAPWLNRINRLYDYGIYSH